MQDFGVDTTVLLGVGFVAIATIVAVVIFFVNQLKQGEMFLKFIATSSSEYSSYKAKTGAIFVQYVTYLKITRP